MILLRHPIAVSYSTHKWTDIPLHRLIAQWIRCHNYFQEDRKHIRHLHVVRYEDFVEDPASILQEVYEFAGLGNVGVAREVRGHVNRKYSRRWTYWKFHPRAATYRSRIIERYNGSVESFDYGYNLEQYAWF